MKERFAAILGLALGLSTMAAPPMSEYNEKPARTTGTRRQRTIGKFMRRHNHKYRRPHQGAQEIARRKSQIERGIFKVSE